MRTKTKIIIGAVFIEELITRQATIMDLYDPEKRVGMIVDEWGTWYKVESGTNPGFLYQQNTLRDALAAGLSLNVFNNHCDRVKGNVIAATLPAKAIVVLEIRKLELIVDRWPASAIVTFFTRTSAHQPGWTGPPSRSGKPRPGMPS